MLKSVEEVANELGVSKTAIYNKLKLKEYKDLVIKKQGRSMIDETLFNLIKENIKFKNIVDDENEEVNEDSDEIKDNNINSEERVEVISCLMEQLKEKDKQIHELHKLIENSQVLLREKQQSKEEQLMLEEHFKEVDSKLEALKDKMESKKNKKGKFSFFRRKNKD